MASLRDLEAGFLKYEGDTWRIVDTLAEADGVKFLCPQHYAANGGPVGTHLVVCWFAGRVPDDAVPRPGRWTPSGTGLDDLTLSPSVHVTGDWHGFVRNGDAA